MSDFVMSDFDIKHYVIESLREALDLTRLFNLREKQIVEFEIKYSVNITNCRLKYPSHEDEINELQLFVFHRHCILIDVHTQLKLT